MNTGHVTCISVFHWKLSRRGQRRPPAFPWHHRGAVISLGHPLLTSLHLSLQPASALGSVLLSFVLCYETGQELVREECGGTVAWHSRSSHTETNQIRTRRKGKEWEKGVVVSETTVFGSQDVNVTTMVQIRQGSGQCVLSTPVVIYLRNMNSHCPTLNQWNMKVFMVFTLTGRNRPCSVFVSHSQIPTHRRRAAERLNCSLGEKKLIFCSWWSLLGTAACV